MQYVVFDQVTKEIACIYNTQTDGIDAYGRFCIKEYCDGTAPHIEIYDDVNESALLFDNDIVLFPQYFNDEYEENEDDD